MTSNLPSVDTTVITYEPIDLGAGPNTRVTFVGSKYHVAEDGTLHIRKDGDQGNVASFARGTWSAASRGAVCTEAESARFEAGRR